MIQILKKKDGYVLAWVVCVFLIIALVSTIVVTASVMSSQSTLIGHNSQQAYFTAKAAATSVAKNIINNSYDTALVDKLVNNEGQGSNAAMGDYTVNVSYVTTDKIKVKATATYKGEIASVSVYLIKTPAPSGIIPTDNVIYVNGNANNGIAQCTINGSIYVNGDMELQYGSAVNGFVVVQGSATILNAGNSTSGLFCYGNVYLGNGAKIAGDLLTKGDLEMVGNAKITGNAYADGSLLMENSSNIALNAFIGNNVTFTGDSNKIGGILYYQGNITPSSGLTTFVPKGVSKTSNYVPIDSTPYNTQVLPIISTPTQTQMPELYNPVVITNNTISNSGLINAAVVAQLNQKLWGTTITIDARTKDINLLIKDTNFSLSNGINIEVDTDGTHNVYIYMTGSSSLSVNSNEYIGMKVRSTNPRIFIFGDGTQSINLRNNSELDACVYIPNGTITATGSPLTTYKFVGTCIVKNANIANDVLFHYSKPDIEGTPLAIFQEGQYSSGGIAWLIESWGSN